MRQNDKNGDGISILPNSCVCVCLQWHKTAINFVLFGNIEHNAIVWKYVFSWCFWKKINLGVHFTHLNTNEWLNNNAQSIKSEASAKGYARFITHRNVYARSIIHSLSVIHFVNSDKNRKFLGDFAMQSRWFRRLEWIYIIVSSSQNTWHIVLFIKRLRGSRQQV